MEFSNGVVFALKLRWRKTTMNFKPSRMRKKPDGHEYLGAGIKMSGLIGEFGG
jgi:hypothetical protein